MDSEEYLYVWILQNPYKCIEEGRIQSGPGLLNFKYSFPGLPVTVFGPWEESYGSKQ